MRTNGDGNDGLLVLVPVGGLVVVVIIVAGGPANAVDMLDVFLRDIVRLALEFITGLL
jgi:hypothetical protein